MNLIKINATASTNDYLKTLATTLPLPNFTVVYTENQTQGKGQRGAKWKSNPKNSLTFSVLYNFCITDSQQLFTWNLLIAQAIIKGLERFDLTKNYIKWPNDILAGNKKICGILIENQIKKTKEICSIVGIGINVLDTDFENLPQAGSIFSVYKKVIDKMELLTAIVEEIEILTIDFPTNKKSLIDFYEKNLYKKNVVSTFELPDLSKKTGIIKGINQEGKLIVLHENDSTICYDLKEIKLLY